MEIAGEKLSQEQDVDIALPVSEEDSQAITGSVYVDSDHHWTKTDTIVTATVGGAAALGLAAVYLRGAYKVEHAMNQAARSER